MGSHNLKAFLIYAMYKPNENRIIHQIDTDKNRYIINFKNSLMPY